MARALIVGCGCRGRALGSRLAQAGWVVRGTTREPANLEQIEAAGIEGVVADPDRVGTVLEHVDGVAVVVWLMGSPSGGARAAAAVNGPRLERTLEKLVDSPVRGFVYEAAGSAGREALAGGVELVARAAARWRIPVRSIEVEAQPVGPWLEAFGSAVEELAGG